MHHRIRLSEAAFAPLEVYVLDVAILESPDEDEAATALEIKHAIERLPNGGAVLHLPDDEAQLWRWHAILSAGAESAHDSGDHSWEKSLAATASKVLEPLRERERKNPDEDEPDEGASENWPISKIDPPANERGFVSHRAWYEALKAAGWVSSGERPDLFAIGDTALVSMDNGYESWATITRFYKNGAVGVLRREGRWNARGVWKRIRENKGNQNFIRRTPARDGAKRKFRYTYDPDLATRVNIKAKVKEKLRVPHRGVIGHYEVVGRLSPDVVGVRHDETGHLMAITDVALRELARDVYRPGDGSGSASREDVRHRHEREDALPRSRYEALRAIEDASEIEDHDFAQADAAYHAWKTAGVKKEKAKIEGAPKKAKAKAKRGPRVKRPPKPPPWEGGQLDAFEADLRRGARGRVRHFSSLLEAFEHATRGARTWRDLEPALALLRDVKGFEEARFPNEVYERHNQHAIELDEQGHTIDVEQYGATLEGSTIEDVGEAVFLALTTTPPRLRAHFSDEDEARAAREDVDEEAEDDLWAWA